jgi:hypothetical protein
MKNNMKKNLKKNDNKKNKNKNKKFVIEQWKIIKPTIDEEIHKETHSIHITLLIFLLMPIFSLLFTSQGKEKFRMDKTSVAKRTHKL